MRIENFWLWIKKISIIKKLKQNKIKKKKDTPPNREEQDEHGKGEGQYDHSHFDDEVTAGNVLQNDGERNGNNQQSNIIVNLQLLKEEDEENERIKRRKEKERIRYSIGDALGLVVLFSHTPG